MKFRRIKWNGSKVHLEWETRSGEDVIEHKLVSDDPPEPLLNDALAAFIPEVLKLLELPEHYGEGIRVTSLSLNYEAHTERMGAVVTSLKELQGTNAPLALHTPHLRESDPDDEGLSLPDRMVTLIDEAQEAAKRYVNGHRSQGELFDSAA